MPEFLGLTAYIRNVKAVRNEGFIVVRDVSRKQVQVLFVHSQANCPVDKGDLKASGKTRNLPSGAQLVYTAPHAFIVHENLKAKHKTGRSKFVEAPLRTMIYPTGNAWFDAYRQVIERSGT